MIALPGCRERMKSQFLCGAEKDVDGNTIYCNVCQDQLEEVRQQIKDAIEKQIQLLGQPPETNGFKIAALIDVERVLLGEEVIKK